MASTQTISLLNEEENDLDEKAIQFILEKLKQIYSLKEIIDTIITEAIQSKLEEGKKSNGKDNNKLNDFIALICKKVGSIKIFSYLLEDKTKNDGKIVNIEQKSLQKEDRKNKTVSISSTVEDDVIEINNDDDINDIKIVDNSIIKVEDEDENMIRLTDSDNNIDNNIVKVYDNKRIVKYGREGFNSELKRKRKRDSKEYSDKNIEFIQ